MTLRRANQPVEHGVGTVEHYLEAVGKAPEELEFSDPLVATLVDRTLLKPDSRSEDIENVCDEAVKHGFKSVCVNPYWIEAVRERLAGSEVKVCTVIGFPLGANTATVKAFETQDAIERGAHEVDMVINIGALKSGDHETVLADMRAVAEAAKGKALTKAIIETSLLTDEEKVVACKLAMKARIDFVKTSTGFTPSPTTPEDVFLMRSVVGECLGVKASGGIRTRKDLHRMVASGASRVGTGSPILEETPTPVDGY